jgi:hypothetical protein
MASPDAHSSRGNLIASARAVRGFFDPPFHVFSPVSHPSCQIEGHRVQVGGREVPKRAGRDTRHRGNIVDAKQVGVRLCGLGAVITR